MHASEVTIVPLSTEPKRKAQARRRAKVEEKAKGKARRKEKEKIEEEAIQMTPLEEEEKAEVKVKAVAEQVREARRLRERKINQFVGFTCVAHVEKAKTATLTIHLTAECLRVESALMETNAITVMLTEVQPHHQLLLTLAPTRIRRAKSRISRRMIE